MGPTKEARSKTSGHGCSVNTLLFLKAAQNFSNSNVNSHLQNWFTVVISDVFTKNSLKATHLGR